MPYRIAATELLAATYGKPFTPTSGALPHMSAQLLPDASALQARANLAVGTEFTPTPDTMDQAKTEAWQILTKSLNEGETGDPYTLSVSVKDYIPILDRSGNVIGHDGGAWLYKNGDVVEAVIPDPPDPVDGVTLGVLGCVSLSLEII